MPDYASLWLGVWTPYATYGKAPNTNDGVRAVVEEVEGLKFVGNLRLLDPFYSDLAAYRLACRDLHANPVNPNYLTLVDQRRHAVEAQVPNFHAQVTKATQICADISHAFSIAAAVLRNDPSHMGLVKPVLAELATISKALAEDAQSFAPGKSAMALDAIRRNP